MRITTKGQVTIPIEIREVLGLLTRDHNRLKYYFPKLTLITPN